MGASQNKLIPKSEVNILIVDDREDNLFAIETILQKDNYTIVKANSGRAALKILLQQHDFSLILMDVQMPELNGFETATIIYEREKLRDIPIIFITAYNFDDEFIFKGYRMGGVDYIYKPINPELLRMKVGVFVELHRKNQQLLIHEKKLMAANHSLQKQIEERKASEEKVRLLNEQLVINNANLKTINEELDQFAYAASHDLQEPLRKIMVFSDKILQKGITDEETEKYFGKIINASKRMQTLINDLLSFSRNTASVADFTKTDLNVMVQEAMNELEMEIEKNKAEIIFEKLPEVWAIPSLVQQLFYNLLGNAIKFRKKDEKPVITIQAKKLKTAELNDLMGNANGTNYYMITVSDNGIGFEKKYTEDIFRVFKRLHSYHEYQGSGVGLSICKKIIEKHNGFINAESKPGIGSSFFFGLPEKQVEVMTETFSYSQ